MSLSLHGITLQILCCVSSKHISIPANLTPCIIVGAPVLWFDIAAKYSCTASTHCVLYFPATQMTIHRWAHITYGVALQPARVGLEDRRHNRALEVTDAKCQTPSRYVLTALRLPSVYKLIVCLSFSRLSLWSLGFRVAFVHNCSCSSVARNWSGALQVCASVTSRKLCNLSVTQKLATPAKTWLSLGRHTLSVKHVLPFVVKILAASLVLKWSCNQKLNSYYIDIKHALSHYHCHHIHHIKYFVLVLSVFRICVAVRFHSRLNPSLRKKR